MQLLPFQMRVSKGCAIKLLSHAHDCDVSHKLVKFGAGLDENN